MYKESLTSGLFWLLFAVVLIGISAWHDYQGEQLSDSEEIRITVGVGICLIMSKLEAMSDGLRNMNKE